MGEGLADSTWPRQQNLLKKERIRFVKQFFSKQKSNANWTKLPTAVN